jgi:hypothetical protein
MTNSADPVINLMLNKIADVLGSDDFAVSLTTQYLMDKGSLDQGTADQFDHLLLFGDFYYLIILFLAGLSGLIFYLRKADFSSFLILIFDGMAIAFLFLENQSRSHYFLLPLMAILAGWSLSGFRQLVYEFLMNRQFEKARERKRQAEREKRIAEKNAFEEEIRETRAAALHAQFDMEKAIAEGHIRIIASEAVGGAYAAQSPQTVDVGRQSSMPVMQEAENITVSELDKLAQQETGENTEKAPDMAKPGGED